MPRLLCLALVTLPAVLLGAEVTAPKESPEHALVRVSTPVKGTGYAWFVSGPDGFVDTEIIGSRAVFTGRPGRYAVMLVVSDGTGKLDQGQAIVTITGSVPTPVPTPTPPGPTPDPVPPQPPTPPPTPVAGPIRALVIYETADIGKLTWEQVGIINSNAVRSYFTGKGYRGPDSTLALRFWDDDYPQASIPADWWATYDAARTEAAGRFPYMVIESKSGKVFGGQVGSEAEALSKLKQWGGE